MKQLEKCYLEEDLFPKLFTNYEERAYGILFYNPENKDSYDSNHAVIYRDKIKNLKEVLEDVKTFYKKKNSKAIIYQSMLDDNYFEEIKENLAECGYTSWMEEQKYMLPMADNQIKPNSSVEVITVSKWDDSLKQVFLEAEEPWEIPVLEKSIIRNDYWCFEAFIDKKPAGLIYGHINDDVCRVDYMLVSTKNRGKGVGRTLFDSYVKWIQNQKILNSYLWPDGETPEKIYYEGGYRIVEIRRAGRAVLK